MRKSLWSLIKVNTECMMCANTVRGIAYFKGKVDAYLVILCSETSCTQKEYDLACRIVDKLFEKKMLFHT